MRNLRSKSLFSGVLKFLARRIRTEKEIKDWLNKKEASDEETEEILQKLRELKLINDLEYAESFIRTRILLKQRSIKVLKLELRQKGVDKETIEIALRDNPVDEKKMAEELIEKNMWRWRKFDERGKKQKIKEFLLRKGFYIDIAR